MKVDGDCAPKSPVADGPAKVFIPARASAANWNAVKSLYPSQRLPALGQQAEIKTGQETRPAVAAAQSNREFDARVRGHAHDRGQALVVRRREALPSRMACRVDDDAVAHRLEPRDRAGQCRRFLREARGCVKTDAVGA